MSANPPAIPVPPDATPLLPPDAPRGAIRWVAVLLAALGWWLCFDLLRIQYGSPASNPLLQQLCSAEAGGPLSGCRSLLGSEWGSLPLSPQAGAQRMPLSAVGMGYFAFVGLWFLLIGRPTRSRAPWQLVIAAVVGAGVLASLRYTLVMQELGAWCAGCLAVHAVNALLALAVLLTIPWTRRSAGCLPHPRGSLVMATFFAGGFAFLLHLSVVLNGVQSQSLTRWIAEHRRITSDPAYARWNYERQPKVDFTLAGRPALGPPDAPHTLVMFGDFQCVRCRDAHRVLSEQVRAAAGRLRLVFVHCPLDQACYPELPRSVHPLACAAARAAEAVHRAGGPAAFERWSALAFERQGTLTRPDLLSAWAGEIGLDAAAIAAELDADWTRARVAEDVALARELKIQQTPLVYLDGRRLEGWDQTGVWMAWLAPPKAVTAPADAPAPANGETAP